MGAHYTSREDIEAKFRGNAALVLPPTQVERAIAAVHGLARAASLSELLSALAIQ